MSAALSLLPASSRPDRTDGDTSPLDVVHDHVVRLLGDTGEARAVLVDAVLRTNARATELGEAPTLEHLLRQAHARLRSVPTEHAHDEDLVVPADPVGRVVARALAVPSRRSAAVLDLTARHGLDLRTAADVLGMDRTHAARARTEALQQVRAAVVGAGGTGTDVEATLAALPLVPAPATLHELLDDAVASSPSVLHRLHWVAPVAAMLAVAATIVVGVPRVGAASTADVPVASAQTVEQGPAVQQLRAPATGIPTDEVEQLEIAPGTSVSTPSQTTGTPTSEPAAEVDASPTPTPTPTPEPSPTPAPSEPDGQPTDGPGDEPSEGPLERLLPTGP